VDDVVWLGLEAKRHGDWVSCSEHIANCEQMTALKSVLHAAAF
jgi:hypothetical protein